MAQWTERRSTEPQVEVRLLVGVHDSTTAQIQATTSTGVVLPSWPNGLGIRLLSGFMGVRFPPAAQCLRQWTWPRASEARRAVSSILPGGSIPPAQLQVVGSPGSLPGEAEPVIRGVIAQPTGP